MARGFRRQGTDFVATLDKAESRLVAGLARDVLEMLDTRVDEPADADVTVNDDAATAPVSGAVGGDDPTHDGADEDRWWEALGLSNADLMPSADESTRRRTRPEDPALARLLPDLVADSDATQGEAERLRALTEPVIVEGKREALAEAVGLLTQHPLRVPDDAAPRFASALNDIRLVLAQRLGIESEEDARRVHEAEDGDDEVERYMALLYGFVSWLQESLMTALLKRR